MAVLSYSVTITTLANIASKKVTIVDI